MNNTIQGISGQAHQKRINFHRLGNFKLEKGDW